MLLQRLLIFAVLAAVLHAVPLSSRVHEVEDEPNFNPFINLGAKTRLIEGDIALPPGRIGLINTTYRWKFPIPYILSDSLDLNAKGAIYQAFEVYRLKSCVDFKPYEGEKTYIKFEKGDGCWSFVGDQQNGQVLSLGPGCDHKAVIEHELLHALGFYHMQSRQDRDDYVKIWLDQVIEGLEHNFNKYDDSFVTDLNTPYDYESVMHYRPFAFNKDPSIPTITTNIPEFYKIIGQYLDFSEMDIVRLNRMYNCSSSLTLLDQCAFEKINICGMVQSSTDDGDWVHLKSSEDHTLSGQCRDLGYTMHFDTSSGQAERSALIESRILYPKRKLQCLQFFYKMTGSAKDRLVIWARMDDGTGEVRKLKKLQTIWADEDKTWKIAHVPMQVGAKFRYAFQAVKGDSSSSATLPLQSCLKDRSKTRSFNRPRPCLRDYSYHMTSTSMDGSVHSSHLDSPHSVHLDNPLTCHTSHLDTQLSCHSPHPDNQLRCPSPIPHLETLASHGLHDSLSCHSAHLDSQLSCHRHMCCAKADPFSSICCPNADPFVSPCQAEDPDMGSLMYSCAKMADKEDESMLHLDITPPRVSHATLGRKGTLSRRGTLSRNSSQHEDYAITSDSTGNIRTGPWKNETTV